MTTKRKTKYVSVQLTEPAREALRALRDAHVRGSGEPTSLSDTVLALAATHLRAGRGNA